MKLFNSFARTKSTEPGLPVQTCSPNLALWCPCQIPTLDTLRYSIFIGHGLLVHLLSFLGTACSIQLLDWALSNFMVILVPISTLVLKALLAYIHNTQCSFRFYSWLASSFWILRMYKQTECMSFVHGYGHAS